MFNEIKSKLFDVEEESTSGNAFTNAVMKESAKTVSGNGALKYSTTGSSFLDQFGAIGLYRNPRPFDQISKDMSIIYALDPKLTIKLTLYIRMISRITQLPDGTQTENPQRGAGLRHEAIMRMIWLAKFHPDDFWANFSLFISTGSWRDVFIMLSYDLQYHGWENKQLDWTRIALLIIAGLENPQHSDLIRKYLPNIRPRKRCRTLPSQADNLIGKYLVNQLFCKKGETAHASQYKQYRMMKTQGAAHEWQKHISRQDFDKINFDSIHGRALMLLVSSKFLANQGLEQKYLKWIASKPVAKFVGYPHELVLKYGKTNYGTLQLSNLSMPQIHTFNKQWKGLVETAKKGASKTTSYIVVRDTSGSMTSNIPGQEISAFDVAKALALFFSEMLPEGAFADHWIEFNYTAVMHKWRGSTPYEKWNSEHASCIGNTRFQAVIDLFVSMKAKGIAENEFPTGIVCISDGEFDPAELGKTNVEVARAALEQGGFSKEYVENFGIVLWNIPNGFYGRANTKFETNDATEKGTFYFGGYDPAILAFLTGIEGPDGKPKATPQNAEELFHAAMDQELLNMVD